MIFGTSKRAIEIAIKVPEIGLVKNVLHWPWLIVSACLIDCSAIGPKIKPIIKGAAGKSNRRIPNPSIPKKKSRPTSNTEFDEP
jgi:hypothetical protein